QRSSALSWCSASTGSCRARSSSCSASSGPRRRPTMALPNQIDPSTPADTDNPRQGDDQIRALKVAVGDIWGIPNVTLITAPLGAWGAAGLTALQLSTALAAPTTAEQIQVGGSAGAPQLSWSGGTYAQ